MSFGSRSDCPQASQMCCDTRTLFGKDIPRLDFVFRFRDDDWWKDWRVEKTFPWVYHQSRMYYHPSSFVLSPIPQLC